MPIRETQVPSDQRRFGRGLSGSPELEARCERQRLDIYRLTGAVDMFRRRNTVLEAVNAELRAENQRLNA